MTAKEVQAIGGTLRQVANAARVSPDSLRSWRRAFDGTSNIEWRGRPPERSARVDRQELLDDLKQNGMHQSIESLQREHRKLAKREVRDLVRRARNVVARRGAWRRTEDWLRPGVLWALDHTFEGEGQGAPVLVVRDVAARKNLLAIPVADKSLPWVEACLDALFEKHDAPLVLRMDGGFVGTEFFEFLARHGVLPWVTHPGSPWENGSVERANGDLKRRVAGLCEALGLPDSARVQLYERARVQSNTRVYPRAFKGKTPEEVWARRQNIQPDERAELGRLYTLHLEEEEKCLRAQEPEAKIEHEAERRALEQALVDLGFLVVRSVRFTPPISTKRSRKIACA